MPKFPPRTPISRRCGKRCSPSATTSICGGGWRNIATTTSSSAIARARNTEGLTPPLPEIGHRWRQVRRRQFEIDLGGVDVGAAIYPVGHGLRPEDQDHDQDHL